MEQGRYWMWTKRRHGLTSHHHHHHHHHVESSTKEGAYYDSWEEQAFAEDASGTLGGCIWPPRSYSCSFCGREFRSAQALGGHMNVHRRDRARLKQSPPSPSPPHHEHHQHQNNIQDPFLPLGFPCQPDEVCNFVYNPNPNSNHGTTKQDCPGPPLFSSPKPWSNLTADRYGGDKNPRTLVARETRKEDITVGCKRKRTDDHTPTMTLLPFVLEPISIQKHHHHHPPADEDNNIDLELRLGDPPKGLF
ncbi:hypothetical protein E1A91_A11G368900v1 [Gossypium mustelinum]|uniref:C2H2-type domain-containing protein n=1 Tax=Gossypium mustelinum TaxID=34275 RepID=A0A5D2XG81_GOSMU|nr:hypothetical protein E1A91_A11G368900v1 [Gossypium mustelinum]